MVRNNIYISIAIILILVVGAVLLIFPYPMAVSAEEPQAPTTSHTWPILRHDSGHTGYNPEETVFGPDISLYDRLVIDDPDASSFNNILVGSNRLYVQNLVAIWAYDRDDLSFKWRYGDCLSDIEPCIISNLSGLSQGRIVLTTQTFFPTPQAELVVLDSLTGDELWSRLVPNDFFPVVALDGSRIHLMWQDSGYHLVSLSVFSGDELASGDGIFDGAFASGGPVVAGGRIFFSHGDQIFAHSTANGDELWWYTDPLGDKFKSYDLVALDDVLVVAQAERVFALSTADKTVMWEKPTETCAPGYQETLNVIATDGVYVSVAGICNEDIVTYNLADGVEQWRANIGMYPAFHAIAIANGVLYVASLPTSIVYQIWAFDIATGTVLEQHPIDNNDISMVMAISDGFLYTISSNSDNGVQIFERTPADLSVAMVENQESFCSTMVGGILSYQFSVINSGPGVADDVQVDITLPPGTVEISTTQGTCTIGGSPTCSLGSLEMGERVDITAEITLSQDGVFSAGIEVTSQPRDPNEDNNRVSQSVEVDPLPPSGVDLQATNLEITQGIQNLANDVQLVEGKHTVARAYIQTNGPQVNGVTALLHGSDAGGTLPGSPLKPVQDFTCVDVDANPPDRSQLDETVLFQLPDEWVSGEITLEVEVNPGGSLPDNNPGNDTFSVPVTYQDAVPVCIRTYRVRTAGAHPTGGVTFNLSPPSSYLVADPDGIIARTLSLLPTAEIIVIPESQLLEEWEPSLFTDDDYGPYEFNDNDKDDNKVMTTLWWHKAMTDPPAECVAAGARTHYLGMIHENTSGSDGVFNGKGVYDGARFIARLRTNNNGDFDDPPGGTTVAHELGHNYDRRHVPNADDCGSEPNDPWYSPWLVAETDVNYPYDTCTLDDGPLGAVDTHFGFDLLTKQVVNPAQTGDLMSYAFSRWTSDYTWNAFLEQFQAGLARADATLSQDTLAAASTVPDLLLVNGEVLSTTVRLDGLLRVPQTFIPTNNLGDLLDVGVPSPYSLELLDDGNTILITKTLTLQVSTGLNTSELLWFNTGIPFITDTVKIRVSLDGTPVVTQTVSPNAPVANILSPIAGDIVTDTLTISWEASDPDQDSELIYMVQYSNDQGNTWRVLASNVFTDTLTVDSSLLPGSLDESLVRVIASDGVNTGSDQSAFFTITPRDPLVFIQHPAEGAIFNIDQPVSLHGTGYDPEDGSIPAGDLNWTVSGIGVVGSGKKVTLYDLSPGFYRATLTATDSNGNSTSDDVTFLVGYHVYLPLIVR